MYNINIWEFCKSKLHWFVAVSVSQRVMMPARVRPSLIIPYRQIFLWGKFFMYKIFVEENFRDRVNLTPLKFYKAKI